MEKTCLDPGTILASPEAQELTMEEKLEQLEAVLLDALRSHREEERRQWGPGLIPGEPVDGEALEREQVEEYFAA